jgi:hypothetical protein
MARKITSGSTGTTLAFNTANVDVTANIQAVAGGIYWCNTTAGPITLTLPPSPSTGDSIEIYDIANAFDTNALTVARNAQLIMGTAEDMTVTTEGAAFTLVYYNVTYGWRILTV